MDSDAPPPPLPGENGWIPVNGTSLAPLARRGDRALVRGCGAAGVRRGDLALVRRGTVWAVRLVVGVRPLRTAALREPAALEEGQVRGRVAALERAGRVRPLGAGARLRGLLLHRVLSGRAAPLLRRLRERLQGLAPLRMLRALRAGEVRVRPLAPADGRALAAFAARHLPHLAPLLARQLAGRWQEAGVAIGAFDAAGRMVGFIFLDEYRQEGVDLPGVWARALSVAPRVRRLGVGRMVMRALVDHARSAGLERIFADVRAANPGSLRLLREAGWRDATPELTTRVNALFAAREGGQPLVVLEHDLAPAAGAEPPRIAQTPPSD